MTEPTDRDREMAAGLHTIVPWSNEIAGDRIGATARALAAAREEGRREERERCAAIADDQAAKGDEDGDPAVVGACRIAARRIRAGEGAPK